MVDKNPTTVIVKCQDCKKVFEIDSDMPIGEAVPGHTWGSGNQMRHRGFDDYRDEQVDKEICSDCGVPHRADNPYTGCGL